VPLHKNHTQSPALISAQGTIYEDTLHHTLSPTLTFAQGILFCALTTAYEDTLHTLAYSYRCTRHIVRCSYHCICGYTSPHTKSLHKAYCSVHLSLPVKTHSIIHYSAYLLSLTRNHPQQCRFSAYLLSLTRNHFQQCHIPEPSLTLTLLCLSTFFASKYLQ